MVRNIYKCFVKITSTGTRAMHFYVRSANIHQATAYVYADLIPQGFEVYAAVEVPEKEVAKGAVIYDEDLTA